jgi:predicted GNAT superfamily acetyltransferase
LIERFRRRLGVAGIRVGLAAARIHHTLPQEHANRSTIDEMILRDAQPDDFDAILALNASEETQTSPLDPARLVLLDGISSHHRVAVADGQVAGFLLAMRSGATYANDNFRWFSARYPRFLYVDRIVVSAAFSGRGIGSALYDDLIASARSHADTHVVCEYNLQPPNPASARFHMKYGFTEAGVLSHPDTGKRVSMQALPV